VGGTARHAHWHRLPRIAFHWALGELSRLVALLAGSGDASPAGLMFLGLGLIGLRDRIERGFRGDA
jgi:hypothetical protein